jgi:serine/threonine-protein kinase
LALAPDGSLYIAERSNSRIRKVDAGGIITTVAGTGVAGFSGDGGPATQAQLNEPYGVSVGPDGCVYIADTGNSRIRRIGLDGIIVTIAGGGLVPGAAIGDGGPATQAEIFRPYRVAFGSDGSLYVVDRGKAAFGKSALMALFRPWPARDESPVLAGMVG